MCKASEHVQPLYFCLISGEELALPGLKLAQETPMNVMFIGAKMTPRGYET